jgi:hypothetical protein
MLTKLSDDAVGCLQHAADCERQAQLSRHPLTEQSFLDLANRWRRIAETFEFIEGVDRFLAKPRS